MARTNHLPIYQSVFVYTRELYRLRAGFPKLIKHDLGQEVCQSSIKLLKCVVVANGTFPIPFLQGFVEQSVLVHEFGHAIGLVNNGIPLESDHHDAENGAHCTNRSCIMYYLNEGLADLRDFINSGETSTDRILFGQECLDDVAALLD